MIRIFTARDAMEAHFVKSLLEDAGIEAAVEGEYLQQIRGDIPFTMETLPKLCVRDEDRAAAEAVVNEFRARLNKGPKPSSEPWQCICGEKHAAQFAECWKCGKGRPGTSPSPAQPGTFEPTPPEAN